MINRNLALLLIIFLEGYVVLSTELLAIRLLIPFTGNSTHTVIPGSLPEKEVHGAASESPMEPETPNVIGVDDAEAVVSIDWPCAVDPSRSSVGSAAPILLIVAA